MKNKIANLKSFIADHSDVIIPTAIYGTVAALYVTAFVVAKKNQDAVNKFVAEETAKGNTVVTDLTGNLLSIKIQND